jgi:hypothetical protein
MTDLCDDRGGFGGPGQGVGFAALAKNAVGLETDGSLEDAMLSRGRLSMETPRQR